MHLNTAMVAAHTAQRFHATIFYGSDGSHTSFVEPYEKALFESKRELSFSFIPTLASDEILSHSFHPPQANMFGTHGPPWSNITSLEPTLAEWLLHVGCYGCLMWNGQHRYQCHPIYRNGLKGPLWRGAKTMMGSWRLLNIEYACLYWCQCFGYKMINGQRRLCVTRLKEEVRCLSVILTLLSAQTGKPLTVLCFCCTWKKEKRDRLFMFI